MEIAGLQKNSFIDYRGKVAAVIFTPGCNFNCYYCHNRVLICEKAVIKSYQASDIISFLKQRGKFLDGLVVSGGEPTLQKGILQFLEEVKEIGYPVKLDTNGSNPEVLEKLMDEKLIDYVAMDIKAPFERYNEICGVPVDIKSICKSISLLISGNTDYEFRTTVVPELGENDIISMAISIKHAELYVLQQFKQPSVDDEVVDCRIYKRPHSPDTLIHFTSVAERYVNKCITRGI